MVRKAKPKPKRLAIKKMYRGKLFEFVDKLDTEIFGELARLEKSWHLIKRFAAPLRRLTHPAIRAVLFHIETIQPNVSIDDPRRAAEEVCRINMGFCEAVNILSKLNSEIEPLERLRFYLTYSCTHRKRDLKSGWNKGKLADEDEEPQEEQPATEAKNG